jgi:peroxiredoxin (alkyl hydroperoxide reductase subunit C)
MPTTTVPDVGQMAPDFRMRAPDGAAYTLSEYRGEKNVLLVFYPLAFSPVCSHQLPEVQEALPRFERADTVVFGVSVDSRWSNGAFARSLGIGFTLLSDFDRRTSTAYGVLLDAGYSARASFLVDKQGRIAWRQVSEDTGSVDAIPSLDAALAAIPGD